MCLRFEDKRSWWLMQSQGLFFLLEGMHFEIWTVMGCSVRFAGDEMELSVVGEGHVHEACGFLHVMPHSLLSRSRPHPRH